MSSQAPKAGNDTADRLLRLTGELVAELHPREDLAKSLGLDSLLERDLAIDSLARVELFARVQAEFGIHLPERSFAEVETPRDLIRAIAGAGCAATPVDAAALSAMDMDDVRAVPGDANTLTEVLQWHVACHPDRPHIHFYSDEDLPDVMTYGELWAGANEVAAGLQQRGLEPGDAVTMMLPTGTDYFLGFFGILLAGGVPVPIYPPVRMSQLEDHLHRQAGILNNCGAVFLITVGEARPLAHLLMSQVETLRAVVTAADLRVHADGPAPVAIGPGDIAFLQYTSGSTGHPKGVILTHDNLLANIRADGQGVDATARDIFVSWLPLYHDMGLIGAWLGSLYFSVLLVIMSPLAFLGSPQRWLWAIHRHRGTLSAAPNFAYELCNSKVKDEDIEGLDLGSWRVALNGAEGISPQTVTRFCERFAAYGFRPEAMFPVYGLAENAVGLTFPKPGRGVRIDRVQREPLMRSGRALPADAGDAGTLDFVCCGRALPGHKIRIVDRGGLQLPEREQGRLQFNGPSATSGYYHNPEQTRRLFRGEWLETGDLGYIADGELYITGRIKDIVIRGGRNIYPEELEEAVGKVEGIRKGRVAVFGSRERATGTEQLVIVAESRETGAEELARLRAAVHAQTSSVIGETADDVVLAPPGTILKTSSGKLRRAACRDLYERGLIGKAGVAPWRQLTGLLLAAFIPQLRRLLRAAATRLYSGYTWALFYTLAAATWLAVMLAPVYEWRWRACSGMARLFAFATATRLVVTGGENLPGPDSGCIIVANHASYLDSFLLAAVLPWPAVFVAKGELDEEWLSRTFLDRLRTIYVERFDRGQSVTDAQHVIAAARAGRRLIFFPEGTFVADSELLPFHMGAFVSAAEADVPVVPVAIRGTRQILGAGSSVARRGSIRVVIGEALIPGEIKAAGENDNWAVAVSLRDEAERHIQRYY